VAVAPLLRVRVGVPLTERSSEALRVRVTLSPIWSVPAPPVRAAAGGGEGRDRRGSGVDDDPGGVADAGDVGGGEGVAGEVGDGAGEELGDGQVGGGVAGDGVDEGERRRAGAAAVGGGGAVAEGQGGGPETARVSEPVRVRVTLLPTERSPLPAVMPVPVAAKELIVGAVVSDDQRACRVADGCEVAGGEAVADGVGDGAGDGCDREVRGVLAGADKVGEGERGRAGGAAVGGGGAVAEGERRRAGDGEGLAAGEGQRDGAADREVARCRR
jgi:hypothetical protein